MESESTIIISELDAAVETAGSEAEGTNIKLEAVERTMKS